MTFEDLFQKLQKLTPEQRRTEVCGFEAGLGDLVFWASTLVLDEEGRPTLEGTADVGGPAEGAPILKLHPGG